MKLDDLGYNDKIEKSRIENNLEDFDIGRVISEHKERYIVKPKREFEPRLPEQLEIFSQRRKEIPAVGRLV